MQAWRCCCTSLAALATPSVATTTMAPMLGRAQALSAVVRAERQEEQQIDAQQGGGSPPIIPPGWVQRHDRDRWSSRFQWDRTVTAHDATTLREFMPTPSDAHATLDRRRLNATKPFGGEGGEEVVFRHVKVFARLRVTDFTRWDHSSRRNVVEWVPFRANVAAPGRNTMVVDGAVANSKITFLQVGFQEEEDDAATEDTRWVYERESGAARPLYAGPPFRDLSRPLQLLLSGHLHRLGLTPGFGEFLCQSMHYEEHQLYLRWLAELDTFAAANSSRSSSPPSTSSSPFSSVTSSSPPP